MAPRQSECHLVLPHGVSGCYYLAECRTHKFFKTTAVDYHHPLENLKVISMTYYCLLVFKPCPLRAVSQEPSLSMV